MVRASASGRLLILKPFLRKATAFSAAAVGAAATWRRAAQRVPGKRAGECGLADKQPQDASRTVGATTVTHMIHSLWSHVPNASTVSHASNRPQSYILAIGNCLGSNGRT